MSNTPLSGDADDQLRGRSCSQVNHTYLDSAAPVCRLVGLIKRFQPYLDRHGRAYCRKPGLFRDGRASWPLDGDTVQSLLAYSYCKEFGFEHVPTKAELTQAISLARGELWHGRPELGQVPPVWSATVKAIGKAVEIKGDFVGSASDALELLQEVVQRNKGLLTEAEVLPLNADQLGTTLNRIGLFLREIGIEVHRPARTERKRLWAWAKVVAEDDAPDPIDRHPSSTGSLYSDSSLQSHDAPDTPITEQLRAIYSGESSDEFASS